MSDPNTNAPRQESAQKPGKDDVHEQREHAQPQEGAVRNPASSGSNEGSPIPPPRH